MIISSNRSPSLAEFQKLVSVGTSWLNNDAHIRPDYYLKRHAQLLEDDVMRALALAAEGTKFAGTIKKISGQKFPDIVAAKYYGVEVKSAKDEKWVTLGGSINESTRVENVERIFLIFGKLTNSVEFRSRPYEECLSEVVVTHYPRYKIDMNLSAGATIFDKMATTYDELRLSADPVGQIVDYYKSQLGDGESLWWTGKATEQFDAAPMKIRLWRTLTATEKRELMVKGFAYFPNLLSNASTKYEGFSLWLAAKHGVISTSTRDAFSAGGQGVIKTADACFTKVPRAIMNIYENSAAISMSIFHADESVLRETWRVKAISSDRIGQWIDCVAEVCMLKNQDVVAVLNSIFKTGVS